MVRRVPILLLVLAIVLACGPAQAIAPAVPSPATVAPADPTLAAGVPSLEAASSPVPNPLVAQPWPLTAPPSGRERPTTVTQPSAQTAEVPAPTGERRGRNKPYAVSLASMADFVPQYTSYWCVGASLQMTRSIITGDRDEARRSQRRLWEMARDRSPSPYGGANPIGWSAALNDLGLGPYRLVSVPTLEGALTTAAGALERTGRPVGLVMWAGRHAWLMTGFESTRHPRRDDAQVTGVRVMDPLYPGRTRWGRSPAPNRLVSVPTLARQFVMRDRPDYDLGMSPGWLLIVPIG